MKNRWQKSILCQQSENGVVYDILLIEVQRKFWWDPLSIFSPSDKVSYHKKIHKLIGEWKIDYTNTAHITKKWNKEYKKYIRQAPSDVNGIPSVSWIYDPEKDIWNPSYDPPLLGTHYPGWELDSVWVWTETKKCYIMSEELCKKYSLSHLYNSNAYYTEDGIKYNV
jgi:hypothetical protein